MADSNNYFDWEGSSEDEEIDALLGSDGTTSSSDSETQCQRASGQGRGTRPGNTHNSAGRAFLMLRGQLRGEEARMECLTGKIKIIADNARMPQTTKVIKTAIQEVTQVMEQIEGSRRITGLYLAQLEKALEKGQRGRAGKKSGGSSRSRGGGAGQVTASTSGDTPAGGSSGASAKLGSRGGEGRLAGRVTPPSTPVMARRSRSASMGPPSPLPSPLAKRKGRGEDEEGDGTPRPKRKIVAQGVTGGLAGAESDGLLRAVVSLERIPEATEAGPSVEKCPQKAPKPPGEAVPGGSGAQKEGAPERSWATVARGGRVSKGPVPAPSSSSVAAMAALKAAGREATGASSRKKEGKRPPPVVRPMKAKPPAVEVTIREGVDYGSTLKRIKAEASIGEQKIKAIRRTRKGNLLIEVDGDAAKAIAVKEAVARVVGDAADVSHLEPRTEVEVRDIDEVTEQEEVVQAIEGVLPETKGRLIFRALKTGYGGMRAAVLTLPSSLAEKLSKVGHVKIGWVSCRVRTLPRLTRCFRCHGLGHTAARCGEPEGPPTCRKCGEEGHFLKECRKAPVCKLCAKTARKGGDTAHITGSRACPVYVQATRRKARR